MLTSRWRGGTMMTLAAREMRAHVGRYLLTALAVAIGVMFMGGMLTLTDTIRQSFHDLIADVNDGTDAWVQGAQQIEVEFGMGADRPRIDAQLVDLVDDVDEVDASAAYVEDFIRLMDADGEPMGELNFGPPSFGASWVEVEQLNPFVLTDDSRAPEARPAGEGYEVVLDRATATDAGYELGDTVSFQTNNEAGEAELVGIARFGTADSPFGASFALFAEETSQQLLAAEGRVDGIGIVAAPGSSDEAARDAVAAQLSNELSPDDRERLEVLTGEQLTADETAAADEQLGFIRTVLMVFAAISVAVGAFVIYTSFSFIVAQRQRQTALLRAVGATRRQTLWSVLVESFLIGVLASIAGYAVGVGLAQVLSRIFLDEPAPLILEPTSAAIALAVGVVVTIASAFVPAWRASRIPPLAAMRAVAIDRSHRSSPRLLGGVLALVAGAAIMVIGLSSQDLYQVGAGIFLVFLGLVIIGPLAAIPATLILGRPLPALRGVVGRVAQRNAERNPKRTAYTGSALMIGLGVVSLILVMNASIARSIDDMVDNRFAGDFVVDAGTGFTGAGLPGAVTDEISSLDDVDQATGVRFGMVEIEGSGEYMGGFDPAVGFDLFDVGVVAGDPADMDATSLAVFADEAASQGYELGDELSVTFAETGEHTFSVDVLIETQDLTGAYLMPNEAFDENIPSAGDTQVWVRLDSDAEPGEAEAAVEETLAAAPAAELLDLDEFKDDTRAQLDPLLLMLGVLLALTIVVAMIGIVNTLVLSIVERTQEIGLTRAVGATRNQVRASIRWEALLIAAFGLMAALAVGVLFGWVIVQALEEEGFTAFVVPVAHLAVVTAVTAVLTLLAALVPAWWGARRPILPAIATD